MIAYLDNSATTQVSREAADKMMKTMIEDFGNPSSMHRMGVTAEKEIKEARRTIAKTLSAKEKEIYFTSGGTEANNLAIRGIVSAQSKRGNHIITSEIEHPAVLATFEDLKKIGFRVSVIPVDEFGLLKLDVLEKELSDETILLSIMHVNNEVGSIQPIDKIVKIARKINKCIKIHVDAVQSYGKLPLNLKRLDIDALSISAHKFHGPKGVGVLYLKDTTRVVPMTTGGGQEKAIRPGTENVPGIVGMAVAAKAIHENIGTQYKSVLNLKNKLYEGIVENIDGLKLNSLLGDQGLAYVLNVSFVGIRGEVLLHALEEEGIYVSTGSACSSNQNKSYSHVLEAMGLDTAEKEGAIRFSLSYKTTEEEIVYAIQKVVEKVKDLDQIIKGR